MIMGCMHKEFPVRKMIKVLIVVWISNFVGSVIFAAMVNASTQYNFTSGLLGAFTIKVAMGKLGMSFQSAFISGILCNFFVCIAVLMAAAAKDIAGKVFAIFFPILAFVVSGYEHCVANMYYIPAAIFAAADPAYVQAAQTAYGYTAAQLEALNWSNFFINNLVPVTLGNIVGGMVFVGLPLYLIHSAKIREEEAQMKESERKKKAT
jgi:formate/nitrite transporter